MPMQPGMPGGGMIPHHPNMPQQYAGQYQMNQAVYGKPQGPQMMHQHQFNQASFNMPGMGGPMAHPGGPPPNNYMPYGAMPPQGGPPNQFGGPNSNYPHPPM